MAKLEKLMEKKKDGKELDPAYKDAKMSMLKALRDEMAGMMRDDLKGHSMKKVQVASDSAEGLEHGLDKAKDLISGSDEMAPEGEIESDDMFDVSPEMEESAEHEAMEAEAGLSPEEEEILARLLAKQKR